MDTLRMFALYDEMSLPQLAERLDDFDEHKTPYGWTPELASHRLHVERRILDLVTRPRSGVGATLRCDVPVRLRSSARIAPGVVREIATGGLVVDTDRAWTVGTAVEIQVLSSDEGALRVRGVIRAVQPGNVRVSLGEQRSEGDERRIRRFVLEAIRRRVS